MVAAMRTGHWSPTRRHSSGRGARNQASSPPTRSYGVWSPTSWTTIGHRSRSPSGCGGSFAVTRRCGSPMNRSTVTCTCRRGKCLTPACSTVCGVTVRSDGRAERSVRTVAARSGTWSPSASDRPRPTPGRWPATGRVILCSERAHRRSPPSSTAPPATRWSSRCPTGNKADAVARALIDHMGRLPAHLRRSLTWDRGSEMAQHAVITDGAGAAGVLLRPAPPMAARHQREHEPTAAPIPAQERRPGHVHPGRAQRRRRETQPPPASSTWLGHPGRSVRRCRAETDAACACLVGAVLGCDHD